MRSIYAGLLLVLFVAGDARAQEAKEMSFFVTSVGTGKGGNLGGLEGADRHCQALAQAAGAGGRTWRAYLSSTGGPGEVHARDRIGKGPWKNAKGVVVAESVEQLHGENNINKQTALNEKGEVVNGRGDRFSMHDMLTGSTRNGRAFPADRGDRTCSNWTSDGNGVAMVGHHDRIGTSDDEENRSWNSSHRSRGCSVGGLAQTGGAGLFYCFAAD